MKSFPEVLREMKKMNAGILKCCMRKNDGTPIACVVYTLGEENTKEIVDVAEKLENI